MRLVATAIFAAVLLGACDQDFGQVAVASEAVLSDHPLKIGKYADSAQPRIATPTSKVAPKKRHNRWTPYVLYAAAVGADYASTRAVLAGGGRELLYRCSPHRPGCISTWKFATVSSAPLIALAIDEFWLKRSIGRTRRLVFIGAAIRFGAAAWNTAGVVRQR